MELMLLANPGWTPALTFLASLLHIGCPWDPLLTNKKWYFSCHICQVLLLWENLGTRSSLKTYFVTFSFLGHIIIINALAISYWILWWLSGKKKKKSTWNVGDMSLNPWVRKIPWRREATHSSILAWEIPWMEETGGLQSMGLQKSWTWQRTEQQQQLLVRLIIRNSLFLFKW